MKMKKRFLFFVIWISVMVLLFASVLTMKVFADENGSKERTLDEFIQYELWVGGVQVTSYNCHDILDAEDPATGKPTASFNPETNVLELHNPVLKDYYEGSLVYSDLEYLKIKGTLNYYGVEQAFCGFSSADGGCIELFEDEEVKTDICIKISKGQGGVCIENYYGDVIISGGNIYLEHSNGKAILCNNLSVEGGKLHLKNTNNWECLEANPGDIKLQNNMKITTPKDGRVRTISTQYGDQVFMYRTITGKDPNNEATIGASEIVIEEPDGLSDTYTLTLHWSSMDGVDITGQYPISLSGIKSGTSVSEALSEYGFYDLARTKFFNKIGYTDTRQRNYKPMNYFSEENDIHDTRAFSSDLITEDMDIYCYMGKNIDKFTFDVDAPLCGSSFSSKPIVHLPKDSHVSVYHSSWIKSGNTIQAGKEYEAIFEISADFKYALTDNVVAFVNGEKINNNGYTVYGDSKFIVKTKAVHSLKKVAAKAATCGKAGNKEYWTCSGCKKIFSDASGTKETTASAMTIKPTGKHTWDKGEVTKAATCTVEGVKTYTCTVCKTKKTERIKATGHNYGAWTKLNATQHQRVCKNDKSHVQKANHTWDAGKVTKKATTAATGVKTFTCTTCKATKTETIAKLPIKDPALRRIYGGTRYTTSFAIAEAYMKETGQKKLNSIIVANGEKFPDALAGSYLGNAKKAPIIIWNDKNNASVQAFIKQKVKTRGTVYILGGTGAVKDSIKKNMGSYKFIRLSDSTRYGTNIKILDAAGIKKTELLVCDGRTEGKGINALIASATGKPLLLVDKGKLTDEQKVWLAKNKSNITKMTIIGDAKSVDTTVEKQLKAYGKVTRITGKNPDELSATIAKIYRKNAKEIFIATMDNYPDGLCGGVLAIHAEGPMLLVNPKTNSASANYAKTLTGLERANIFGGAKAMPEATARKVAKNTKAKLTIIEK